MDNIKIGEISIICKITENDKIKDELIRICSTKGKDEKLHVK